MFSLNNPKNWANPVIPRRSHFVGKLILRITVSDGVTTGEMVIAEEWNVRIARSDRVATPGSCRTGTESGMFSWEASLKNGRPDRVWSGPMKPGFNPMGNAPHQTADASRPQTWAIWRTDDNGNTFLVRSGLTHPEALRLVAEFEARGHKQLYWAEPEMVAR